MRQKRDISDRRSKIRRLQPLFCLQQGRWVTVRPVRGHLTPKNEYNLFYQKLDAEYFFIQQLVTSPGVCGALWAASKWGVRFVAVKWQVQSMRLFVQ